MKNNIDFTTGPIYSKIIKFAIPVFLGQLFQILYNTTDAIIVGKFISSSALAAVTSSAALINMIVSFFLGLAMGAAIVISKFYGAKDYEKLNKAVHTDVAFAFIVGILVAIVSSLLTPKFLLMMNIPDDIMVESTQYFKIYCYGLFFTVVYNISMGIMNALGDTRFPLFCLIFSSILNVILDLFFIAVLGYGVGSAAFATLIAQACSSAFCMIRLIKGKSVVKVNIKDIKIDVPIFKEICRLGIPSSIQNSVVSFSNVVIQSTVNTFGATVIAGTGIFIKIENYVFIPITSVSMALVTFMGQNMGAKDLNRAKKGSIFGIYLIMVLSIIVSVIIYAYTPLFATAFTNDEAVIEIAKLRGVIQSPFFIFLGLSHIFAAILRGSGLPKVSMMVMVCVWCVGRVLYLKLALLVSPTVAVVFSAHPVTWCISTTIYIIYYTRGKWMKNFK